MKTGRASRIAERAIALGFMAGLALMAVRLVRTHLGLILFPYQLELREGAVPLFTQLLVAGGNPYDWANQPQYTNVYGPLYNLVVYPFARLFGPTLEVHRAVAGLFILACCALLFGIVRRRGGSILSAFSVALVLYAALICRSTPLARPDALGEFLFLAGIFIPWWYGFSARSLAASVACGVLAFLTKPYFLLAIPLTAGYLFLFVSKRKGLAYALGAGAAMAVTVAIANVVWESYLYDTFAIHVAVRTYSGEHVLNQLNYLVRWHAELLLLGLALAVAGIGRLRRVRPAAVEGGLWRRLDLVRGGKPLLAMPMDPMVFYLLGTLVVFVYPLGGHKGAWMQYTLELVLPFLLVLAGAWINAAWHAEGRLRPWAAVLAAMLVLSCLYRYAYPRTPPAPARNLQAWRAVEGEVAKYDRVLGSPVITSILMGQGKPVYNSGQPQFFLAGTAALPKDAGEMVTRVRARADAYGKELDRRVLDGKFDLLVVLQDENIPPAARARILENRYRYLGTWVAQMPHMRQRWSLEFWARVGDGRRPAP